MEFADFIRTCDESLHREQVYLNRSILRQDVISFESRDGCSVTVDGDSVFSDVHRVCLNRDDSDVFVYLVFEGVGSYRKFVLGEITSFVIS